MIEFHSLEEMIPYYEKDTDTFNLCGEDVEFLFDVETKSKIKAHNITARRIIAHTVEAAEMHVHTVICSHRLTATRVLTKQPTNLVGEWANASGSMEATIQGDVIDIYWIDSDDGSKALYWSGTYVAPTDATEPYTWESQRDEEKTSSVLSASTQPTKTFSYSGGVLSYETYALGISSTLELKLKNQ